MSADSTGPDDSYDAPIRRGHRFGPSGNPEKYEVDQEIGAGAAAVVFKGHVVDSGRPIAVKVINLVRLRLKPDFKREKEKLRREAELKGSVGEGPNHSNHSNSFKIGISWNFSLEDSKISENFNIF